MAERAILREICCYVVGYSGDSGCAVEILRVAPITIGWQSSLVVVGVAGRARDGRVCARKRKNGRAVVERRAQPCGGRVALRAVLCESCIRMIRNASDIRRTVVVIHMAAVTIRRQRSRKVVGVAGVTSHCGVRSRERKAGGIVVKGSVQPGSGVVTHGAVLREVRRDVVGHSRDVGGAVKILRVAAVTIGG